MCLHVLPGHEHVELRARHELSLDLSLGIDGNLSLQSFQQVMQSVWIIGFEIEEVMVTQNYPEQNLSCDGAEISVLGLPESKMQQLRSPHREDIEEMSSQHFAATQNHPRGAV